jgi:hypothetical protein
MLLLLGNGFVQRDWAFGFGCGLFGFALGHGSVLLEGAVQFPVRARCCLQQ